MKAAPSVATENAQQALRKTDPSRPAFQPDSRTSLTATSDFDVIVDDEVLRFVAGHEVYFDATAAVIGGDYDVIATIAGRLISRLHDDTLTEPDTRIGGFHYAPGGNATGTAGGDGMPAINPYSCWDLDFQPACDPRGMIYVAESLGAPHVAPFWRDIYFLNTDPALNGTSRLGAEVATGAAPPKGHSNLNYYTASEVLAKFGKQLMSLDEFAASTYGVTERSASGDRVKTTALDSARTSRFGGMQDTGNLWCWGHDGHVDIPAAAVFGGDWAYGSYSGSRASNWAYSPSVSSPSVGARGRCDHLPPAQPAR